MIETSVSHWVPFEYVTKPIDWGRLKSILAKFKSPTSDETIMIVEGRRKHSRNCFRRNLEGAGWTITEAVNGRNALEKT